MRRLPALLVLAAVSSFSPGALAGPPTEAELAAWSRALDERRENFGKDGAATQEAYFKIFTDAAKSLPVEDMTPRQLSHVQERRILSFGALGQRLEKRLAELDKDTGVDGAIGLILRLQMIASDPKTMEDKGRRTELIGKLLDHPALPELIRTGESRLLLRSIAEAGDAQTIGPSYPRLERMVAVLEREGSPDHLDTIYSFYEQAAGAAPSAEAKAKLLESLTRYGQRAVAELEKSPNVDNLDFFKRDVATLAGAATRGKLLNHPAPELKVDWASDSNVSSLAQLNGKVVVLDFWDSHCGPCIGAIPKMQQLADRYKGLPVQVLGVTHHVGDVPLKTGLVKTGDDFAKERGLMPEYFKQYGITWPNVMTNEDSNSAEYGVRGIPTYVLIDSKGVVRHKDYFNTRPLEDKFARIDALLKEAGVEPPPPVAPAAPEKPATMAPDRR
jgi:thiol-disulfide isomerase/thioredoxin